MSTGPSTTVAVPLYRSYMFPDTGFFVRETVNGGCIDWDDTGSPGFPAAGHRARIRPLFRQGRMAVPAGHFPGGLPGDGRRRTGWMRVGAAGDPGPWRRQAIPGRGRRDADALRGPVREQSPGRWPTRTRRRVRARPVFRKGRDVVRRGAAVRGTGGQGHQLPGGRFRLPRLAPRPRPHRPGAVPAEGVGGRSGAPGRCACAGRHRVRHRAGHRAFDGRAGHRGGCSVSPGRRGPPLWCCVHGKEPGRPERDVFPGRGPTAGSPRGASRWPLPEPPRGPPGTCRRGRGGVCRRVTARKAGDCMTGSASNWPVRVSPEPGPVACRVAARSPRSIPPFSRMVSRRHGHRETRRGRGAPPGAGESFRTAKTGPGPGHTGTRSWHGRHRHVSPGMPAFAMTAPVRSRANAMPPPKKHSGQAPDPVPGPAPDPVVDAGNPPRLHPTRAKADTSGACHRVVTLATGPPGRRTGIPSQSRSQL